MAGKPFGRFFLLTAIVLSLLSCAKSIAPPGGPIDRIPPDVIATVPVTGSINIPLDSKIELTFSEKLNNRGYEQAIFITPQLVPDPKIKISGSKIIIEPKAPLKENRTYVITLGTDIKDAHNVKLAQSINVAFSTGPILDTGTISGTVYKENKPTPNVSIALFESLPDNTDSIVVDSLIPEYITQSGQNGLFEFNYIPPQNYFIVAFEDKNKNRRINPANEMIGLPSHSVKMDSTVSKTENLKISLSSQTSNVISFKSVSINEDNLIKVRLTDALDSLDMKLLFGSMTISELPEKRIEVPYHSISPLGQFPASDFVVLSEPLDTLLEYEILLDQAVIFPQVEDSLRFLTYTFSGKEIDDKNKPAIIELHPSDSQFNILPGTDFYLRFTEPVNVSDMNIEADLILDSDTMPMDMTSQSGFYFTHTPSQPLMFGSKYIVSFDGKTIIDKSGNRLSDSLIDIHFTTIGADTLGHISGGIQYSSSDDAVFPVTITFNPVNGGESKTIYIERGQIEFVVDLVPGYYSISGYIDKNTNAAFDFGSIIPYTLAEPFSAPADTFRVRSRFVTEDAVVEF